ncbi:MAG TPA: DapH/DapD/GlmU-related protein [Bacteroidales bacterium]|nr:DapH/DapD/GlmU-related protein [Bacteroidales bacterium]HQB21400.1 DapH/DapD/GlmU-related protein [Bacteroidales bacterium]
MSDINYTTFGNCIISPKAVINSRSIIGKPYRKTFCGTTELYTVTEIKDGVYVGFDCIIGNGTIINNNSIIDDRTIIETGVTIGFSTLLIYETYICSNATIGDNCVIGGFICDRAKVGNNCRIFGKLTHKQNNPLDNWDADESIESSPVIHDNVFIGMNSLITAPVNIGPNSYICAGAIVTRDVPTGFIAHGINKLTHYTNWKGELKNSKLFHYV